MVNVIFVKGPDMFAEFGRVLCFVCWNNAVWFLHLVLKLFSASLMCLSSAVVLTCDGGMVD